MPRTPARFGRSDTRSPPPPAAVALAGLLHVAALSALMLPGPSPQRPAPAPDITVQILIPPAPVVPAADVPPLQPDPPPQPEPPPIAELPSDPVAPLEPPDEAALDATPEHPAPEYPAPNLQAPPVPVADAPAAPSPAIRAALPRPAPSPPPAAAPRRTPRPDRHAAAAPATTAVAEPLPAVSSGAVDEAALEARIREAVQAAVRYPAAARMMGLTGRARVQLDYRGGDVTRAALAQSAGVAALDDAAISAVRSAHYPPAPPQIGERLLRLLVWVEFRPTG